ncbi:EamA family transporter [Micromonospora sp. DT15]|uniref:EamA family transporter n=1 Tax=Micromonospora sp. DT15 TaxID=3393445 RepID=UPI003CEACD23
MDRPTADRWRIAAALLAVWLLWGSTFLGIRVVVQEVPPLFAAGVRFSVAGALLLGGLCWHWRRRGQPGLAVRLRGHTGRLTLLGLMHFLGANGLVSVASEDLPSAAAGTYFATVPIWVLVMGGRPRGRDLGAATVGLAGVAILLGFQPGPLLPSLLVLAAALTWAVAGRIAAASAGRGTPGDLVPGAALSSAVQMLGGGLALLVVSGFAGEWGRLDVGHLHPTVWLAQLHLVLLGSLVGFLAYTWLVTRVDQRLASTYSYVNPLVAVALGALVLGEDLTSATVVGTACLVAAVAWTVRSAARPAASRTSDVPTAPAVPASR